MQENHISPLIFHHHLELSKIWYHHSWSSKKKLKNPNQL